MPTGSKSQPNKFNDALNTVIRMKMAQLGYNITDLSTEADIPRPTLSRILSNHKDPELAQIQRIAIALKTPIARLMSAAEDLAANKDPF